MCPPLPPHPLAGGGVEGEGGRQVPGDQGARGEPGPMERQTDGNGRRDGGRADPRIGRLEGAGKGKPGSCAS